MGTKDSRGQGLVEFSEVVRVIAGGNPGEGQRVSRLSQGLLESRVNSGHAHPDTHILGTPEKTFHLFSASPCPLWGP